MGRRHLGFAAVFSLLLATGFAAAREWKDASGSSRVEAELVTIKGGKVYLEKTSGDVIHVPLERLSKDDLAYLAGLPDYRTYFIRNPIPGLELGAESSVAAPVEIVKLNVPDEAHVGQVRGFANFDSTVKSLAFSPNAGFLAVGRGDDSLMMLDLNKSAQVSLHAHLDIPGGVTAVAFTPDGKKLLSGEFRGRIRVWNVDAQGRLSAANQFVGPPEKVNAIDISSDGQYVLSGSEHGVHYWRLEAATEEFRVGGFRATVGATRILPTGNHGLASDGAVLVLIDLKTGEVMETTKLVNTSAECPVAIASGGSHIVVGDGRTLRVWDIRDGRELPPLKGQELLWSAAFSPDGKYVISGDSGSVRVWEVASSHKVQEFTLLSTHSVMCLAYSPDRRHIAAMPGSSQQTLEVFRLPLEFAQ